MCSDAHVPAALLKLWLRELYIPLIPGYWVIITVVMLLLLSIFIVDVLQMI